MTIKEHLRILRSAREAEQHALLTNHSPETHRATILAIQDYDEAIAFLLALLPDPE